jgi:hypothetical protein
LHLRGVGKQALSFGGKLLHSLVSFSFHLCGVGNPALNIGGRPALNIGGNPPDVRCRFLPFGQCLFSFT